jgi:LysR family transcriptional activator of nhaA
MSTFETTACQINFHHLRAFWHAAREGSIASAAGVLRVSPSALSMQISALQRATGHAMFERTGRNLRLTATGREALAYADRIFTAGRELEDWLGRGSRRTRRPLRVGALSSLSKNLQFDFIWPLLRDSSDAVTVREGSQDDLLADLQGHGLDVMLSSLPAGAADAARLEQVVLGEMPAFLVGRPPFRIPRQPFPRWLEGLPLFLPSRRSTLRVEFDTLVARARVRPQVRAEVDDMALLRLLALSGAGLALVPRIVVERELAAGDALRVEPVPGLAERFFAITVARQSRDERVEELIQKLKLQLDRESSTRRRAARTRRSVR